MIFAWIASAACGMLLSRYYKQTFKAIRVFQKDVWYRFHQFFMGLAVLLTITGLVVIVVDRGVEPLHWERVRVNPHVVVGFVCIVCAVIQPFMAYFRPDPGTPARCLFWLSQK